MRRSASIFIAWAVGWLVYMIAMVLTVYDGILSLMFQPIMAAIVSALAVGFGLLVGLIFRIPSLGKFWHSSWIWAAILVCGSIFIMCFGSQLGITETFTDSETGSKYIGLRSNVGLTSYFVLIFAVANWPTKRTNA